MKNLLLILALALTVSACSKETPDVDTTEQQHLIVGHWQHYKAIGNDGNQMGEVVDTSRISDDRVRGFMYYSSDGKKYNYEIQLSTYCIMLDTVDYIITSKGNDVLEKLFYTNYPSMGRKTTHPFFQIDINK